MVPESSARQADVLLKPSVFVTGNPARSFFPRYGTALQNSVLPMYSGSMVEITSLSNLENYRTFYIRV